MPSCLHGSPSLSEQRLSVAQAASVQNAHSTKYYLEENHLGKSKVQGPDCILKFPPVKNSSGISNYPIHFHQGIPQLLRELFSLPDKYPPTFHTPTSFTNLTPQVRMIFSYQIWIYLNLSDNQTSYPWNSIHPISSQCIWSNQLLPVVCKKNNLD